MPRCTSSGPSASRSARAAVHAAESMKSSERPAPPWICIAKSMTCWAIVGAATLIWLTSESAFSGPPSSSFQAALSTSSRVESIAIRASAIRSRLPPRLASGLPNAVRSRPRRQAASSAASASPISRMQWCTRPGPSRPWAIANASPGPEMMLATGTRTSVNETSPCPSGSSWMPIVLSIRSTFTPGASIGTSTMVCRWWRSASGSVEAP